VYVSSVPKRNKDTGPGLALSTRIFRERDRKKRERENEREKERKRERE
jgi:hypothetical protein